MKLPHNFYRGRAITMDCHHCITESAERKKGQHLRMEDRGAINVLKKQGLGLVPSPDRSAAPHPPLRMSCGEASRLARATRGKLPVIPPSWEKLSTEPTEHPATGIRKRASAATSPVGWFGRSGNTSGPWMPAADMPSDTTCSSRLRWVAPVPFTTWSGKGTSPSSQWNCPKR